MRPLLVLPLLMALLLAPGLLPAAQLEAATAVEDPGFAAVEALYVEGEFKAAQTAARSLATADGFAMASRSGLILMRYFMPPGKRAAAIEEALADARAALEIDENHLEGNLQAAIAIGYRGKLTQSMRDAWAGRRYIDNALAHHPESAWALAALGGWNGELVMEAGRFFAGTLFGAGRRKAIRHFRAAIEAEPGNIAIRASFAKTLLRFDRSRFETEATAVLSLAVTLPARDALEAMMLQQSRDLLQALQSGQRDELEKLLQRLTAFTDH